MNTVSTKVFPEQIKNFAEKAMEMRQAIFEEKNFEKASLIYHELPVQDLAEYAVANEKLGKRLAQAVNQDIDFIWFNIPEEKRDSMDEIFREIERIGK